MTVGYAVNIPVVALFLVLPWFFTQSRTGGYVLFVGILLASEVAFLGSWGVAWWPWMRQITRAQERAGFFARMRFFVNVFAASMTILFGLIVGQRMTAVQYDVLVVVVIGWLVTAIWQINKLPFGDAETGATAAGVCASAPASATEGLLARGRLLLSNPWYVRLLAVGIGMGFASAPGYVLYARGILMISNRAIAFQIAARTLVGLGALLLWGRLADRYGYRRVLRVTALGLAVVIPFWLIVSPGQGSRAATLALSTTILILTTVFMSGFLIAHLTAVHGIVTDRGASVGLPLYEMIGAAVGYLTVFLAGMVLAATTSGTRLAFLHIDLYKGFLSVGIVAAIATVFLLRQLPPALTESKPT